MLYLLIVLEGVTSRMWASRSFRQSSAVCCKIVHSGDATIMLLILLLDLLSVLWRDIDANWGIPMIMSPQSRRSLASDFFYGDFFFARLQENLPFSILAKSMNLSSQE